MNAPAKDRLSRHHLLIIVTGILLCLGPTTMIFNSWSLFVVPVSTELATPSSYFVVQPTIIFLTCAIAAPFAGRLMDRFDLRIVLASACVLACLAIFLCGFWTELWQFYLSGVLEGLAGVVLMFLMLPTLANRWFAKNVGLVIGICVAMTGVGGAIWAMLGGVIIVADGWRAAYQAFGVIAAVISIPPCVLFVRSRPSEVGLEPYGASSILEEGGSWEERGVEAKVAFRSSSFVLLVVTIGLLNGIIQTGNLLPTYVYHLGDIGAFVMDGAEIVMAASTIGLAMQIAQALGKVSLGFVADRSLKAALFIVIGCGLGAVACCVFGITVPLIVYIGGFLFGVLFASVDILGPTMAHSFFGQRDYTKIYARVAVFINIVPAFSTYAMAAVADASWEMTFGIIVVVLAATVVCGLGAIASSRRLPRFN